MGDRTEVNGLPIPPVLVRLIESGRWRHPGDAALKSVIPFLGEPVDFLTIEAMCRESRGAGALADDSQWSSVLHLTRGRVSAVPVELPWLDADQAVFVAVNRFPGDDLGIVLDYRTCPDDPRVAASEWSDGPGGCLWRQVADTFMEFAQRLGLCDAA